MTFSWYDLLCEADAVAAPILRLAVASCGLVALISVLPAMEDDLATVRDSIVLMLIRVRVYVCIWDKSID